MKEFLLICLLAFTVIIDKSVLAKQICMCTINPISTPESMHQLAAQSCQPEFYCYKYLSQFYCEVTNDRHVKFQKCCLDYSPEITGTWCKEIPDKALSYLVPMLLSSFL